MGDGPREEPVPKAESPHVHGPLNSSQKARPGLEPVAQASPAPTLRNDKLGHPPRPPRIQGPHGKLFLHLSASPCIHSLKENHQMPHRYLTLSWSLAPPSQPPAWRMLGWEPDWGSRRASWRRPWGVVRVAARLLFQVLHLEPGKQLLQQEQEVEQLPLQPPYYDLGTSPSYRPSVRTAQPQPPDKAPPTQLHPAWPRAQLPGWKEDTGSPGDRAGRAQIGAHQGGEGWPFTVAPQQVPWAKQGLDAVRPGRGCGPDALLSPHQACISALGPANDHPKAGSSPSSWPQSQVLGGPASP